MNENRKCYLLNSGLFLIYLFLMEAYNNKNIKNVLLQNLKKENKHEAMKEGVIISQLYL